MEKEYTYMVWALGYDKEDMCIDTEVQMAQFPRVDQAIQFAKCFETLQDVVDNYYDQIKKFDELEGDYFNIRVEKVNVSNPEYSECEEVIWESEVR